MKRSLIILLILVLITTSVVLLVLQARNLDNSLNISKLENKKQSDSDDLFFSTREKMVDSQIEARGIRNKDVLRAMRLVPRHEFVPDQYINRAYSDQPLPINHGQTISQPYIVALMTEAVRWAEMLKKIPPLYIRSVKYGHYQGNMIPMVEREMEYVRFVHPQVVSEDKKEAAAAFAERREPVFKGR